MTEKAVTAVISGLAMEPNASNFNQARRWQERDKILLDLLVEYAERLEELGGIEEKENNFLRYTVRGKTKVQDVAKAVTKYYSSDDR